MIKKEQRKIEKNATTKLPAKNANEVTKTSDDASAENRNALSKILELNAGIGRELDKNKPTIEVNGYTKKFGKFVAAENVTFNVGHGVIHGFIGPNGSGKTTTIKAMIGAYIPSAGRIFINGFKAGTTNANQLIGYIPERASFPSHLNTVQYLVAMGQLSGLKSKEAKVRAIETLKALGLEKHAKRQPTKFSSGMQKKILLAQSLMTNPKILILDEPAANLDPTARKELFDQLILLRDQGKTILISSHILAELERLIDEVTFVYYGDVIFSGRTDSFNNQVADVFIKSSDNEGLAKFLINKGYKVKGDIKTEIIIPKLPRKDANELFAVLSKSTFTIISFRSNDLQSVYDKLIDEAVEAKRGRQMLDGEKVVAMKENTSNSKDGN